MAVSAPRSRMRTMPNARSARHSPSATGSSSEQAELQLRIGVNTGEALVSLGARPEEGEGMVAGDVVNTAARLQSKAPVNGDPRGRDDVASNPRRHRLPTRRAGSSQGKGRAGRGLGGARRARPRGRRHLDEGTNAARRSRRELDSLLDAFERRRSTRSVQLVTLSGEPGIGKSRLVFELFEAVERHSELVFCRQGRSLPYGEGVSFWALGEMVKAHAGILETDNEGERRSEASSDRDGDRACRRGRVDDRTPAAHSAGLEDTGARGDNQEEAFAAWRGFLESIADDRPLVLVFEDLHWADDGLLDFVDHLVDWATRVPLLVVATTRPELLARRPDWGGGKTNALTLSLAPLSGNETAELVVCAGRARGDFCRLAGDTS